MHACQRLMIVICEISPVFAGELIKYYFSLSFPGLAIWVKCTNFNVLRHIKITEVSVFQIGVSTLIPEWNPDHFFLFTEIMWHCMWTSIRRIQCTTSINSCHSMWRYTWTGKSCFPHALWHYFFIVVQNYILPPNDNLSSTLRQTQ